MTSFHEEMACYAQKECSLEEKIARWVSSLDLSHLDIPLSFLPKTYQCLPRQKEAPELYAEGFTKEEDLKRVVLDKILLAQWEGEPALFKKKIVLLTYVMPDGFGDLTCAQQVKALLEKKGFTSVSQVLFLPKKYESSSLLKGGELIHFFQEDTDLQFSNLSLEIKQLLTCSDMILQLPTYYPYWQDLLKKIQPKRFFTLAEYGFLQSPWASPLNKKTLGMGLHFLELGILTRGVNEKDMHCKDLEKKICGKDSWESFSRCTDFSFAYLKSAEGMMLFLSLALKNRSFTFERFVLAITDAALFFAAIEKYQIDFKDASVKEVRLRLDSGWFIVPIAEEGRVLEIVELSHLSHDHTLFLYQKSREFCTCRGDQSFSEVVSVDAFYFYEPAPHAQPFLMDLCAIARQRLENYPSAIEYIRGFLDFHRCKQDKEALIAVAKNMTKQLLDPLTKEGIHLLNHIIMTEYSCNELIYHLVIRELHFLDDAQAKQ